ncbi:MAG: hypothetical protein AAF821_25680 [Cyanobacteria bacterium P01_D01_bin.156]
MVESKIRYLNTDLELVSDSDLTSLVAVVEARDLCILHCAQHEGLLYANLELLSQYGEPETTVAEMLIVIESLDAVSRAIWHNCTKRAFDIGYECGQTPRHLNQSLSAKLLERIAAVKASLHITIYSGASSQCFRESNC